MKGKAWMKEEEELKAAVGIKTEEGMKEEGMKARMRG